MSLNIASLRDATNPELAHLYLEFRKQWTDTEITNQVLEAVWEEALPPTVVGVWLLVSQSDQALVEALHQDHSYLIREFAIKQLGRRMRRGSWEHTWSTIGGVEGMLNLFARFSALHVKHAAAVIGNCSKGQRRPRREHCIAELIRALVPSYYTQATYRSVDERPLLHQYARMVPACSSDFVAEVLDQSDNPLLAHIDSEQIAKHHPSLVQNRLLKSVQSDEFDDEERFWSCLPRLTHLPSDQRDLDGFSPSMYFMLKLLEELAGNKGYGFPAERTIRLISGPLIRRSIRNHVADNKVMHTINTMLTYMEQEPSVAQYCASSSGSFLHSLATYWSRKGATTDVTLNNTFAEALRLQGAHQTHEEYSITVRVIEDLQFAVSRSHRYPLLCHILKYFTKPGGDLDDTEVGKVPDFDRWSCQWFLNMDRSGAVKLLKRLLRSRKDAEFLSLHGGDSMFNHSSGLGTNHADPELLRVFLERGHKEATGQAEKGVREKQKSSAISREPVERAFYAKSAMLYAIASGSLKLYGDVLKWARRYVRDPLTVRTIFGRESTLTTQGIDLLSGVCDQETQSLTTSQDKWQVAEANEILLELFNIACSVVKEPAFNASDWSSIRSIYGYVVEKRLELASLLQNRHNISGDIIYDKVWKGTIATLVKIERIACQPEYGGLQFNSPSGLLSQSRPSSNLPFRKSTYSETSYLFLDNLARARDELWREIRPLSHPAVASLQRPWTRGLPIQCLLIPLNVDTTRARGFTPYLSSRAAEVVFLDEADAKAKVPHDEESRDAIGPFVDDYDRALQLHIMQKPEGQLRDSEISRAWNHAMNTSRGRMEKPEAIRLWRSIFQRALPSIYLSLPVVDTDCQEYPTLPAADCENETLEWNPADDIPQEIKSRYLEAAAIDSFLAQPPAAKYLPQSFSEPRLATLQFTPLPVWSCFTGITDTPEVQEGLIASTLLYIDSTDNKASRVLAKPFPTGSKVRYPALILDSDFLLRRDLSITQAVRILQSLIDRVPSSLLLALATGIQSTSTNSTSSENEVTTPPVACQLLALLTKSDRPQIAFDLILSTIIDRPDTSSWHRQFLSSTLLCRLPPAHARHLLTCFAKAIEGKLEEQQINNQSSDGKPKKLTVKVTTVKYLAQLLHDPQFIPTDDSLDILVSLFQKSAHRDIKIAIVESLLTLLSNDTPNVIDGTTQKILEALQAVVPVAGRLNERIDPQDNDWATLKDSEDLPVIEDHDAIPPIFNLLRDSVSYSRLPQNICNILIHTIVLPAFKSSRASHNKWIRVFLEREQATTDLQSLLLVSPRLTPLVAMFQAIPEHLPIEYFEEWHRLTMANITPSSSLTQLNQRLREALRSDDKEKVDTDAIKHWLHLYDQGTAIFNRYSLANLLRSNQLQLSPKSSVKLLPLLSKLVMEQADFLIHNHDTFHNLWPKFIAPLKHGPTDRDNHHTWRKNCKPVLESIIARIESYHTDPTWRDNPDRQPSFLPSIFDLRLGGLPINLGNDQAEFAQALMRLLDNLAASEKPYHHELQRIETEALVHHGASASVDLACYFGELPDANRASTVNYMRIEMAYWILRKNEKNIRKVPELLERSERLLERWRGSKVEDFRMRGCVGFEKVAWGNFD